MTPSLAALDDAPALKQKEWSRGESGEDTFWIFTTIGRHLTPTTLVVWRYENIRNINCDYRRTT